MRQIAIFLTVILLALPSMGAAQDKAAPASPVGSPMRWFPQDIYPPEAKRRSEQGRVVVQLAVDKSGNPTACKVVGSSGSSALDARTCELALANARFIPAKDARGEPIESTFTLPGVRWALADDPSVDLSTGASAMTLRSVEIDVDEQGRGISCRPLASTNGNVGCEDFTPGTQITPPLTLNGKPVLGRVTTTITMRIEPR